MKFYKFNFDNCCTYFILNSKNKSCILIDPILEHLNFYLDEIKKVNGILKGVIDTHTHCDHLSASFKLKNLTNCKFIMSEHTLNKGVTKKVKNHEIVNIDGIILKCIHTPGHTLDSISIIFEDKILTGDTLLLDHALGRCDLSNGNIEDYYTSLFTICKLPSHLIVYPSHNFSNSSPYTIHYLKKIHPFLKIKNKKEFLKYGNKNPKLPKWMFDVSLLNTKCSGYDKEIIKEDNTYLEFIYYNDFNKIYNFNF